MYKIPRFHVDVDPNTNEVISGTAQIESHQTFYDIPHTKEKVLELLSMFPEDLEPGPSNLTVVDSSGRRHSCNREEFISKQFDDLVNLKTGFAEYMQEKERSGQKNK
jgi:hypothetical protein